nr:MAG TPA: hypothetical protein [Caudoviricetes sp.]DAX31545.1 MAG TPA: hypothetical protein [Caudoviricetes sp.]
MFHPKQQSLWISCLFRSLADKVIALLYPISHSFHSKESVSLFFPQVNFVALYLTVTTTLPVVMFLNANAY